ncbi:MAG: UDP-2,3-diacylglucosamine diphosphatase [Myxococcota bacterium]
MSRPPHIRPAPDASGITGTGWNKRPPVVAHVPLDRPIWMISDLHIGDATPSDIFFGKDHHLMALLDRIEEEDGLLVVAGDAIDFHQAWSMTRVLRAHQELFSALSRLGRAGRLYYVIGNHDYEINLFAEILRFQVCDELVLGNNEILVVHGWQFDPFLKDAIDYGHGWTTNLHHLVERWLGTWIRIPLGEFYTKSNRLLFWMAHKVAVVANLYVSGMARLGYPRSAEHLNAFLNHWAQSNMGDPMAIFQPALRALREGPWKTLVCGHSHLPGIVELDGEHAGKRYVNTGSWTFASSYVVRYHEGRWTCRDWLTSRRVGQELYEPLLDGVVYEKDFWQWWRENYMGFFRFREGEERKGHLRGWEKYVRDYQHLSQLQPLPTKVQAQIAEDEDKAPAARAG